MAVTETLNSGVLYTDRRNFYMNPQETRLLWPDVTPFLTITQKMKVSRAPDADFRMFQYATNAMNAYIVSSCTTTVDNSGTDTVTWSSAVGITPQVGHVFEVWDSTKTTRKGSFFLVTAGSGTGAAKSNEASLTFASGDLCFFAGSAQEEGADSPTAWSEEIGVAYNSTQLHITPVEITTHLANSALRGYSSELARLRGQKMMEHKIGIETAMLLGVRNGGITAIGTNQTGPLGRQVRTTHGIIPCLRDYNSGSNIKTLNSASYSYRQWLQDMKDVYRYTNSQGVKYGICGDGFLAWAGEFTEGKSIAGKVDFQMPMKSDTFGFTIRNLTHQFGELRLVRSPLLTEMQGGIYSNHCIIIDPENVEYVRFLKEEYQTAIQTPGAQRIKDQYVSDCGLGLTLPQKHFALKVV